MTGEANVAPRKSPAPCNALSGPVQRTLRPQCNALYCPDASLREARTESGGDDMFRGTNSSGRRIPWVQVGR